MNLLILVISILVLVFSYVIFFGAPYLPTLKKQSDDAFELLNLKPGPMLLDLGSGDGRVLRAAAQRGIKGIGYELNPLLVLYSRISCFRYRKLVTFQCRNYWKVTLPPCDAIFVFLLNRLMPKLDAKIEAEVKKPVKLVSYAFKIPGKVPAAEKDALFLYKY
jgi:SAM-dependent methyltransferase